MFVDLYGYSRGIQVWGFFNIISFMEGPSPLRQLQSEEGGDNQLREEEGRKQEESFALKISMLSAI